MNKAKAIQQLNEAFVNSSEMFEYHEKVEKLLCEIYKEDGKVILGSGQDISKNIGIYLDNDRVYKVNISEVENG